MIGGYVGKILQINLTDRKVDYRRFDEKLLRKYVGGSGLASKILWDETAADTRPLSPENLLIFMTGPLTGITPYSGRYIVAGISPKTGIWGEAHAGGWWGPMLKRSGFDGVVVRGRAEEPVYVWITNGEVEVRNAIHVWGEDTYKADETLRRETDQDAYTATIGRAGERGVNLSIILSGGQREGRAAARCGLGAVMGDKKLKAIVVKGDQKLEVHDQKRLTESIREMEFPQMSRDQLWKRRVEVVRKTFGARYPKWPVKNWLLGEFKGFETKMQEALNRGQIYLCPTCRTGCVESHVTEKGRCAVYESLAPMGSQCLIDDIEALEEGYDLCQRYGLDTISVGGAVSFAMESYQKGLIGKNDTDGVDLTWGNSKALLEMIRKIGEREGFGAILGEGVKKAADCVGVLAHEYTMEVKGQELAALDPRSSYSLAVSIATSNGGGMHEEGIPCSRMERGVPSQELGYPYPPNPHEAHGAGIRAAKAQDLECIFDCLTTCNFFFHDTIPFKPIRVSKLVEWLNCVTGWDMDVDELLLAGERVFNLKRLFNFRRGISRKDDTLPPRFLTHKATGELPPLGLLLSEYYTHRGWSEEGIPTKKKIKELGLEVTAEFAERLGS